MESWKNIDWYFWKYQISNYWNVKSVWNKKNKKEKILKPIKNTWWYLQVNLYNDGILKKYLIHVLVWKYFIKNFWNKKEVNHIDWNRENNAITNLEWVTPSENVKHKFARAKTDDFLIDQIKNRLYKKDFVDKLKELVLNI